MGVPLLVVAAIVVCLMIAWVAVLVVRVVMRMLAHGGKIFVGAVKR